ncbi:hypothetical protein EVAR_23545_1 [Eumeta japonica]|uniref:Uncharacterized protein n=1 Tax=Eumeta variegata TaxID=151549 RepID=A0A4C1WW38_EUMVA|nr:hypothetical protein EVAR_23545_1 [Eumeta japonica]
MIWVGSGEINTVGEEEEVDLRIKLKGILMPPGPQAYPAPFSSLRKQPVEIDSQKLGRPSLEGWPSFCEGSRPRKEEAILPAKESPGLGTCLRNVDRVFLGHISTI